MGGVRGGDRIVDPAGPVGSGGRGFGAEPPPAPWGAPAGIAAIAMTDLARYGGGGVIAPVFAGRGRVRATTDGAILTTGRWGGAAMW
jgi:hypothetical protein